MTITMFDSTDAKVIPANATAVAGYTGGHWPTFAAFVKRFPNLAKIQRVKSIAVNASEIAHILDVENGDATPAQAPGWVKRMLAQPASVQIYKPVVYANLSTMPAVKAELAAAGLRRDQYMLWVAHYDGIAAVPSGYDAKQYINHGPRGENYDISVCLYTFFPPLAQPTSPTPTPAKPKPQPRPKPQPKPKPKPAAKLTAKQLLAKLEAQIRKFLGK